MGVSTTVGCCKLTSHWSPMCGEQKLQTYIKNDDTEKRKKDEAKKVDSKDEDLEEGPLSKLFLPFKSWKPLLSLFYLVLGMNPLYKDLLFANQDDSLPGKFFV